MSFDPLTIRTQFPSLERKINGNPIIYLDGPGGTQVPERVIDAMSSYYRQSNTNTHGYFAASEETDSVIHQAREHVSTLLNAEGPETISIGANMTTLTYALATAYGRTINPGDQVLITQLDHEANRGPWLTLEESGAEIIEVKLLSSGHLDYEDLEEKISERTKLVAIGWASNALGTINDLPRVKRLTEKVGARLVIDAVHYAPHFLIDVNELACDHLLCSAYKFYGPHVGLLYSRPGTLDDLPTNRLRTVEQTAPYRIETGTLNHAAIRGVTEAIDFLASIGSGTSLRHQLASAYEVLGTHERRVAEVLYDGLNSIPGVTVFGPDFSTPDRAPTISFYWEGRSAEDICKELGKSNIYAWDGHFYAIRAIEVLGLLEKGGVTRLGASVYTTEAEAETVIEVLRGLN